MLSKEAIIKLYFAGLLHDLGKISSRASGLRKGHPTYSIELTEISGLRNVKELSGYADQIQKLIEHHHTLLKGEASSKLLEHLKRADQASATERNISWIKLLPKIELPKRTLQRIEHYPLINPLWIFSITNHGNTAYNNFRRAVRELSKTESEISAREILRTIHDKILPNLDLIKRRIALRAMSLSYDVLDKLESFRLDDPKASPNYVRIDEAMRNDLAKLSRISDLLSPWGFYVTLMNVLRRHTLLIPAAVYGTILPDVPLYSHLVTTSALARCSLSGGYRVLVLDLSGIQDFIRLFARTGGATMQLRGRSLLLELALRACVRFLLEHLGLWDSHVITSTGGIAEILIPLDISMEKLNKLKCVIEEFVLSELNGDIFIALGLSKDKPLGDEVGEIFNPLPLFDPESPLPNFAEALRESHDEVNRSKNMRFLRIPPHSTYGPLLEVAKVPPSFEEVRMCTLCKICLPKSELRLGRDLRKLNPRLIQYAFRGELSDDDYVCSRCLYSQILGWAARDMRMIVEVYINETNEEHLRALEDALLEEYPARHGDFGCGFIIFRKLGVLYFILEQLAGREEAFGHLVYLSFLLNKLACILDEHNIRKVKITLITLNHPETMLVDKEVLEKILEPFSERHIDVELGMAFDFMNSYVPSVQDPGSTFKRVKTFDEIAKVKRRPFMLGFAKADGDSMGSLLLRLASSPSRYVGVSELLKLFFGGVTHKIVMEGANGNSDYRDYIYMVYAGGDDLFLIGHWWKVLQYLLCVRERYNVLFGMPYDDGSSPLITISAAQLVRDPDYPVHRVILELYRALEEYAKEEGKKEEYKEVYTKDRLLAISLDLVHFEETKCKDKEVHSLPWDTWRDIMTSSEKLLKHLKNGTISRSLAYKLIRLCHEAGKSIYSPLTSARLMVNYAYLLQRLSEDSLSKLAESFEPLKRWLSDGNSLVKCESLIGGLPDPINAQPISVVKALPLILYPLTLAFLRWQEEIWY